jgi:hypothetical protein
MVVRWQVRCWRQPLLLPVHRKLLQRMLLMRPEQRQLLLLLHTANPPEAVGVSGAAHQPLCGKESARSAASRSVVAEAVPVIAKVDVVVVAAKARARRLDRYLAHATVPSAKCSWQQPTVLKRAVLQMQAGTRMNARRSRLIVHWRSWS